MRRRDQITRSSPALRKLFHRDKTLVAEPSQREVLLQALILSGLGDDGSAALYGPGENDLGGGHAGVRGDFRDL